MLARMGVQIDWARWGDAFTASYQIDQVARKGVRPYQEMAINKVLWQFAQGNDRALLLMATGTGKTFTVFQLTRFHLEQSQTQSAANVLRRVIRFGRDDALQFAKPTRRPRVPSEP
jgi:predicted helicase